MLLYFLFVYSIVAYFEELSLNNETFKGIQAQTFY